MTPQAWVGFMVDLLKAVEYQDELRYAKQVLAHVCRHMSVDDDPEGVSSRGPVFRLIVQSFLVGWQRTGVPHGCVNIAGPTSQLVASAMFLRAYCEYMDVSARVIRGVELAKERIASWEDKGYGDKYRMTFITYADEVASNYRYLSAIESFLSINPATDGAVVFFSETPFDCYPPVRSQDGSKTLSPSVIGDIIDIPGIAKELHDDRGH